MEIRLVGTPKGATYEIKVRGRWMVVHTDATCREVKYFADGNAALLGAMAANQGKRLIWRANARRSYI